MNHRVITINDIPIHVEVADTEELRQKGLMYRDSLSHDSGMLFVFEDVGPRGFWMKNTRIPLSIAFISETGEILNIEDMNPYDMTTRKSVSDAMCALEVNQGWFRKNMINSGDIVTGLPGSDLAIMTERRIRRIVRKSLLG
tara:strand:- start:467 stop:889 length:423 start_codon:yes stop_codon:yes gene_type:complete